MKSTTTLHTATLLDSAGRRHILSSGVAAYCGALGVVEAALPHDVDELCPRCRDARGRAALEDGLRRAGL